jgi:hypothetical protein
MAIAARQPQREGCCVIRLQYWRGARLLNDSHRAGRTIRSGDGVAIPIGFPAHVKENAVALALTLTPQSCRHWMQRTAANIAYQRRLTVASLHGRVRQLQPRWARRSKFRSSSEGDNQGGMPVVRAASLISDQPCAVLKRNVGDPPQSALAAFRSGGQKSYVILSNPRNYHYSKIVRTAHFTGPRWPFDD